MRLLWFKGVDGLVMGREEDRKWNCIADLS